MWNGLWDGFQKYEVKWESGVKIPRVDRAMKVWSDSSVKEVKWSKKDDGGLKAEILLDLFIRVEGGEDKRDIELTQEVTVIAEPFAPEFAKNITEFDKIVVEGRIDGISILKDKILVQGRVLFQPEVNRPSIASPPFANLSGTILHGEGLVPARDVVIRVCDEKEELVIGTLTDRQGHFSVSRVLPGRYRIEVLGDKGNMASKDIIVEPGADIKIDMSIEDKDDGGWLMFCASPGRIGYIKRNGQSFDPPLARQWIRRMKGFILASPVTSGERVYVCTITGDGGEIISLFSRDGSVSWERNERDEIFATPVMSRNVEISGSCRDVLYVATLGRKVYNEYTPGSVMALDALNGTLLWKIDRLGYMYSSPLLIKNISIGSKKKDILCVVTYAEKGLFGLVEGGVHAFDTMTGEPIWQEPQIGLGNIFSSPAYSDGLIYVASQQGVVYAFDVVTGQKRWIKSINGSIIATPSVLQGKVYIGAIGANNGFSKQASGVGIVTLDAFTGDELWNFKIGDVVTTPAIDGEKIYFTSVSKEFHGLRLSGTAFAFDIANGKKVWGTALEDILASPALVGERLVMAGVKGELFLLNSINGEKLWSTDMGGPILASPAISGESIFIASGRRIAAFGRKDYIQKGIEEDYRETKIELLRFATNLSLRLPKKLISPLFDLLMRSGILR